MAYSSTVPPKRKRAGMRGKTVLARASKGSSRAKGTKQRLEFRTNLRAWCRAKEGRQRLLAAAAGVPPQRVSDWVNGNRFPTLEQALAVIKCLREQGFDVLE